MLESLSFVTVADPDTGNLNGMPSFKTIEALAELRALALETMSELPPGSPRVLKIEQALSNLMAAHTCADHLDDAHQCGSRPQVREGRLF